MRMRALGFAVLSAVLAASALSGCALKDMIYAIPDMNNKMSSMNKKLNDMTSTMSQMNGGVTDQRLEIPLEQLLNYNNYDELSPVPFKLMPWGQKLAEVISEHDLVRIAHLWMNEINNYQPPQNTDANGNPLPYTKGQIQVADTTKLGRLTALMTVCGFLPEQTVTDVIQSQILNYGPYENAAYEILAMRAEFITGVILGADIFSRPFNDVGALDRSVRYASAVDRIARLPFVDRLKVNADGFLNSTDNVKFSVDPKSAQSNWQQIELSATQDLSANQKKLADYKEQMKVVRARIQFWQQR